MSGAVLEDDLENMSDEDLMNLETPPDVSAGSSEVLSPSDDPDGTPPADDPDPAGGTAVDASSSGDLDDSDPMFLSQEDTSLESALDAAAAPEGDDTLEAADDTVEASAGDDTAPASSEEATGSAEPLSSEDENTTPPHTEAKTEEENESDPENAEVKPEEDAEKAFDYKAAYQQIMGPIKANGREIQLNSPEEAVRLIQQGANYTKKMQALAPNLKLMRMLENQGLLDENKLSFLIDLDRKDPQAITKLLKDSQIDPLDLDLSQEPAYKPGNHQVSDQEMAFHTTLEDVTSTPTGAETVALINSQWDQSSKEAIFKEPQIMKVINDHRASGIYAKIANEVERQRMLGQLGELPFIHAYKQVGDQLHASGQLAPQGQAAQPDLNRNPNPQPEPRVLERRPATSKPTVQNGNQARAASSTRSTPKPAAKDFDPFNMTDEEIMAAAKF